VDGDGSDDGSGGGRRCDEGTGVLPQPRARPEEEACYTPEGGPRATDKVERGGGETKDEMRGGGRWRQSSRKTKDVVVGGRAIRSSCDGSHDRVALS
jgi:hypothetical protein